MLEKIRKEIEKYARLGLRLPLDIWALALMWGLDPESIYDSYQKPYTKEEIFHNG
jgi:hypothetical protein